MIPIAKPMIGLEEEAAVIEVLRSQILAQGPKVARFEEAFAQLCGVPYAVAVSSGTTALHLALLAHQIGPGDEVITSPFSFIATANSILMSGARPVFVDISEEDYNIDPAKIEAVITTRTRAIMPVHLYGHPADMDRILAIAERHSLAVIEDAAQAVGATYGGRPTGSFGTACFSFYATKNIMTGEGGMVTTSDPQVADRLRLLRNHGSRVRYYHEELGYNYRMMDLQAAIGLVQLGKLEQFTEARIANAGYFSQHIRHPGVLTPVVANGVRHAFHQYVIRVKNRDEAVRQLAEQGVGTAVFYPVPLHQQQSFRKLGYCDSLPISEAASRDVLALPVHPALSGADRVQIVDAVNSL